MWFARACLARSRERSRVRIEHSADSSTLPSSRPDHDFFHPAGSASGRNAQRHDVRSVACRHGERCRYCATIVNSGEPLCVDLSCHGVSIRLGDDGNMIWRKPMIRLAASHRSAKFRGLIFGSSGRSVQRMLISSGRAARDPTSSHLLASSSARVGLSDLSCVSGGGDKSTLRRSIVRRCRTHHSSGRITSSIRFAGGNDSYRRRALGPLRIQSGSSGCWWVVQACYTKSFCAYVRRPSLPLNSPIHNAAAAPAKTAMEDRWNSHFGRVDYSHSYPFPVS